MSGLGPGDLLALRIEKAVAGGRMLARADGAIVLVSGALPGELVEARIERRQRGTIWARTEQVPEPSPQRVGEPNPCGGCVLSHASYEHQLGLKQGIVQDAFARVARLPVEAPPIVPSRTDGYRMRARLHVEAARIGFYLEGTHTVCAPASTGQLLPGTLAAIDAAAAVLAQTPGAVTSIEVAENRDASERAFHLELARDADPSRLGAIAEVPGITSLSLSHLQSPRVRVTEWRRPSHRPLHRGVTRLVDQPDDAGLLPGQPLPARGAGRTRPRPARPRCRHGSLCGRRPLCRRRRCSRSCTRDRR